MTSTAAEGGVNSPVDGDDVLEVPSSEAASPIASPTTAARTLPVHVVVLTGVRRGLRNALYAALARIVFGFLKVLVKRRFNHFFRQLADEVFSLNPLKWGCVVGSFAMFKPIRAAVLAALGSATRVLGARDDVPGSALIASTVAGAAVAQSVRVMEVSTRTELALYLAARAAHCFAAAHVLPLLPQPLQDFEHYDVVAMGVAGAQILYGIVFSPLSHSAAYMDFLQRCTRMTKDETGAIAAFHRNEVSPALVTVIRQRGLPWEPTETLGRMQDVCRHFHARPEMGCAHNTLHWMVHNFFSFALPMYAPLKISTTLAFGGHKAILRSPVNALTKLAASILSSSLFLTLYCGGPLLGLCSTAKLGIRGGWKIAAISGSLCALSTFLEPKGRRLDLALYCCMHALRSWWLTLYHRGYVRRPTAKLVMYLYTVAVTWLLHQVATEPRTVMPKFRKVLEFATH